MKKLDNKNKTYLNYSTEDGKNAQDILRDKIILKQKSVCGHCEAENNEGLYCKSCGKSLDEVCKTEESLEPADISNEVQAVDFSQAY